jgi:hypothetical protein
MVKNNKKRANGSFAKWMHEEMAEIANSSPKKQKSNDDEEFEYAPLIFHHLSKASENITPTMSS